MPDRQRQRCVRMRCRYSRLFEKVLAHARTHFIHSLLIRSSFFLVCFTQAREREAAAVSVTKRPSATAASVFVPAALTSTRTTASPKMITITTSPCTITSARPFLTTSYERMNRYVCTKGMDEFMVGCSRKWIGGGVCYLLSHQE